MWEAGTCAAMTTRAQVLELMETGTTYEEEGSRLGIPPGQVYLVATGIPADGGDADERRDRQGRPADGKGRPEEGTPRPK